MDNIIGKEILSSINGMMIKNTDRIIISIMFHDLVFDNQRAIFDLMKLGHIRGASSLLRVLFDAHVKANWIYSCATDQEIIDFKSDLLKSRVKPEQQMEIAEMVADIEAIDPERNCILDEFLKNHWEELNSLTYSGIMKFTDDLSHGEMIKMCKTEYASLLSNLSDNFAILSLASVGTIVDNEEIVNCSLRLAQDGPKSSLDRVIH